MPQQIAVLTTAAANRKLQFWAGAALVAAVLALVLGIAAPIQPAWAEWKAQTDDNQTAKVLSSGLE